MTDDDKALVKLLRVGDPYEVGDARHKAADRIEALSAENEQWKVDYNEAALENERLRDALAKSEALQDLAYYNGAKQYASICAQSEDAARDWLNGGCGNRQRDAIAALGETK